MVCKGGVLMASCSQVVTVGRMNTQMLDESEEERWSWRGWGAEQRRLMSE